MPPKAAGRITEYANVGIDNMLTVKTVKEQRSESKIPVHIIGEDVDEDYLAERSRFG